MGKVIEFRGRRIDEMSKEELIEVIQFASEEIEHIRNDSIRQREFLLSLRRTG